MNFERQPAPYYQFNPSPSLTQRINAKKKKGDREKSSLGLKTILVIIVTLALVGFLIFLVYRNFESDVETDVSNSSVPVQGSSIAVSNIVSQVATNSESSTIFNQDDALPLDPQISNESSSLDTSTLNSYDPLYHIGHNLILFTGSNAIFAINPADQELIADRLVDLVCGAANFFYLSNDKMRIYFVEAFKIKCFNFNDRSFSAYSPTNGDISRFLLLKSARNHIIYQAGISRGHVAFNHYCLDESRLVYTYNHNCSWTNFPILLEQTKDGSKIIYACYPSGEMFMKELNNSDEGHQRLFTPRALASHSILCPDDVTLIMCGYRINHWVIMNLASPYLRSESKIVRFNVDITRFGFPTFSFSNDGRTLYVVWRVEINFTDEYWLYTIDVQSLLENDYSSEAAPYNLGEGRQIILT